MSRARKFADLAGSADAGGLTGKNMVVNGAMTISQRSTSSSAGGYCALDRFFINLSGASATFSQETVTLGDSVVGDFINYARLNVTTGNNFCMIRQRVEDVQSVPEGTATISFYAKGTNPGGGVCTVQASQRFGTSGSSDVDIAGQTFTLTSSWQRFDFQFTIPSISGKTIGTGGTSFQFDIGQGSDTSTNAWQIDITGVKLEVGSVATDFDHSESYGETLAKCQRYFTIVCGNDDNTFTNTHAWTTQEVIGHLGFGKVEMRTNPTMSKSNNTHFQIRSGGISETSDNVSFVQSNKLGHCRAEFSGTGGLTAGRGAWVKLNTSSGYIHADAEL